MWKIQSNNNMSPICNMSINKCNNKLLQNEYKSSLSRQLKNVKKCLFPNNTSKVVFIDIYSNLF